MKSVIVKNEFQKGKYVKIALIILINYAKLNKEKAFHDFQNFSYLKSN